MGRIAIPPTMYLMRQPSPLERLLSGLILPDSHYVHPVADLGHRACCDGEHGCSKVNRNDMYGAFRLPWLHAVNVGGFSPEEIEIKVEDDTVVIFARHEEKQGEYYDVVERRRVVRLPEGVDKDNVACFMGENGQLFIRAPFVEVKPVRCDCKSELHKPTPVKQTSRGPVSTVQQSVPKPECADTKPTTTITGEVAEKTTSPKPEDETTERETNPVEQESSRTEEQKDDVNDDDVLLSLKKLFGASSAEEEQTTETKQTATRIKEENNPTVNNETKPASPATPTSLNLKPLESSVRRTNDGLNERFEISLNMEGFDPEGIAIRFVDNELCINGVQEIKRLGIHTIREVQRKFKVPEDAILDEARASVTDSGKVSVIVPLQSRKEGSTSVPIVQLKQ